MHPAYNEEDPDNPNCSKESPYPAAPDGVPYLMIDESPIPIGGLLIKKLMDFVVSSLGLIVLSPVLCAIGLAIRLDSRGPVLYSANRVGYKGKSFKCFKFRTMICEADEIKDELRNANKRQGATFKIENDPRITRVGRILRRFLEYGEGNTWSWSRLAAAS